jgi:hypothetical protein
MATVFEERGQMAVLQSWVAGKDGVEESDRISQQRQQPD